jgi:phage baseplate assembly protein W
MATIPSYFEGLLTPQDLEGLRSQAMTAGLLSAGQALARSGAPSLTPGGGTGIADAAAQFYGSYQGTIDNALQNMIRTQQVQEMVRKQQEAQQMKQLMASAVVPATQTAIPSEVGPAVVETPARFDVSRIEPALLARGQVELASRLREFSGGKPAELSAPQQQYAQFKYGTTNFASLPQEAKQDVLAFGQVPKADKALENMLSAAKLVYETGTGGEFLQEARRQYEMATGKQAPTTQQMAAAVQAPQVSQATGEPIAPKTERKTVAMVDSPSLPLQKRQELLLVKPQEQAATTSISTRMRDINELVDRVLSNPQGLKAATGFGGALTSAVPGSTAANAKADLDAIKSLISLAEIGRMRAESKTGGAVGNMTEKEWPRFEVVAGSLEQAQTYDQVVKNLRNLKGLTTETQNSMIKKYDSVYGGGEEIKSVISQPRPVDLTGIPPRALQMLQADPSPRMKQFFDQKYGKGAADQALKGTR